MTGPEHWSLPGLGPACEALAAGRAVVVPNPSPMTYSIVATTPQAVNAVKQRPLGQNVAISVHDAEHWQQLAPIVDVAAEHVSRIRALLRARITVFAPLRLARRHPGWLRPAIRDGYLAMFNGRWAPLAPLWDRFPCLYGSSANLTGQPPAESASEARTVFAAVPIIDGDALRDRTPGGAASTIVRMAPDGTLSLERSGAQDQIAGLPSATGYLAMLGRVLEADR